MTEKENIKLRQDRGNQRLNIGDRVRVYDRSGNIRYGGRLGIIIEKVRLCNDCFYYGLYVDGVTDVKRNAANGDIAGHTSFLAPFFAEDLELVKPDDVNVGDRVKFKSYDELIELTKNGSWWCMGDYGGKKAVITGIDKEGFFEVRTEDGYTATGATSEMFDKIDCQGRAIAVTKTKVFVSLPITGRVEWARSEAARVKSILERQGVEVVTPFECAPDPDMTDGYYMGRCVEALLGCDRICQYPDCGGSRGCAVERHVAETYGIPKIEYPLPYEHTHGRYERGK